MNYQPITGMCLKCEHIWTPCVLSLVGEDVANCGKCPKCDSTNTTTTDKKPKLTSENWGPQIGYSYGFSYSIGQQQFRFSNAEDLRSDAAKILTPTDTRSAEEIETALHRYRFVIVMFSEQMRIDYNYSGYKELSYIIKYSLGTFKVFRTNDPDIRSQLNVMEETAIAIFKDGNLETIARNCGVKIPFDSLVSTLVSLEQVQEPEPESSPESSEELGIVEVGDKQSKSNSEEEEDVNT